MSDSKTKEEEKEPLLPPEKYPFGADPGDVDPDDPDAVQEFLGGAPSE